MPHAVPAPCTSDRAGSILIMVLLILVVAVMIASTFIAQMTAYRISGTRQSARQIAAQTALAGAIFSKQILIRDYAASSAAQVPQRYNKVPSYASGTSRHPRIYAGPIPPNTTGLNWLMPFEGNLRGTEDAGYVGSGATAFMARFSYAANHHPNAPSGVEPTRPTVIDSMGAHQDVALQYAIWTDFQYEMVNGNSASISAILPFLTPFRSRVHAQPRWLTVGYYDLDFQPLTWADRTIASYEARFSVTPFPLDGCININFGDRILRSTSGGLYRLGYRNPNLPPGDLEVPVATRNSAIAAAKSTFNNDATEVDMGDKINLDYEIGDTTSVSIADDFPFQAYQVTDADKDWVGKNFPLSHQYAASLTNMLGSLILRDGGASVSIRKQSDVTWAVKYTSYSVDAAMVTTAGKYKASSGIGELSMLVNIAFGQGYRGNRIGYDTGIPGDPWYGPQLPAITQVGTPASWRQMHANMGFTNHLANTVTSNDEVLPITDFALTPFGDGLDQTRIPVRNRGSAHVADIDCPWYVNAAVMSQSATKAMICAMDATWYSNFSNPHGENSGIQGYPLHKGNLLPIPPPKADPSDATKIAVWDDGVARTGADGVEGGAMPPMPVDGNTALPYLPNEVMDTGYLRPPFDRTDPGHNYEDPFHANAYRLWRNPIRDQSVGIYAVSPYTARTTGSSAMSNFNRKFSGDSGAYAKREDYITQFAIGGGSDESQSVENINGNTTELNENVDTADERLAWQNDIVSALLKTIVDLRFDRSQGLKLRPGMQHGYDLIEDVETVFLAHLGIAVRYLPDTSKASTVGIAAADYEIHHGRPDTGNLDWPLGRMNQLWSLSQLVSGPGQTHEIGYDRGRWLNVLGGDLVYDGDGIIIAEDYLHPLLDADGDPILDADGNPTFEPRGKAATGQFGFRSYQHASWPTLDGNPYRPTWAALSRILEHRLNDVRMSLFGTPALDLNGDGIVDATTNDGTGVVTSETLDDPGAQLHFSSTGRWYLGPNRFWRVFIKAELWDRRGDTLADESALEQVIVLDPDGDGDLSDSHVLFSRWHANPITDGRSGPTAAGRTEATLP